MPVRIRRTRLGAMVLSITLLVLLAISSTGVLAQGEPSLDPSSVTKTILPGDYANVAKTVHTPELSSDLDIDVMFLSDTTGSMDTPITNVATNATSIMNTVLASKPNTQFGAAQYKDVNDAIVFQVDQQITATVASVQTAISSWTATGGGDVPEAGINALWQLAQPGTAGFRPSTARVIVWFGDASSHDPSNGHTQADAINALVAAGIKVLAIDVNTGGADGLDALGQATAIANGTGGLFLGSADPEDVASTILSGLQNLPITVSMASTCTLPITTEFSPATRTVASGQTASFVETISVAANAAAGVYECYDYALIDGVPMTDSDGRIIREDKTISVPSISKTATTTFSRSWDWSIDKSVDQPNLWLDFWQPGTVNYAVNVDGTATDSNWNVSGVITVTNPSTTAALTVTLTDVITGGLSATISADADCNLVGSTLTVPINSVATCPYARALPDGTSRTNTASMMGENAIRVDATAPVTFTTPNTVTDECIGITDSYAGNLGAPCMATSDTTAHFNFAYDREFGPYPACYELTFDNTASVTATDTGSVDSDSQTVTVTVHCIPPCCTQISSYWLQNSVPGSKRGVDPTWYKIEPSGSATPFFLSPYTYRSVLLITPRNADRAYYTLAQQYITAELNLLRGSTAPWDVVYAMWDAKDLFEAYTPADVAAMTPAQRQQFTDLASTLYSYNYGYIGPGRCPPGRP